MVLCPAFSKIFCLSFFLSNLTIMQHSVVSIGLCILEFCQVSWYCPICHCPANSCSLFLWLPIASYFDETAVLHWDSLSLTQVGRGLQRKYLLSEIVVLYYVLSNLGKTVISHMLFNFPIVYAGGQVWYHLTLLGPEMRLFQPLLFKGSSVSHTCAALQASPLCITTNLWSVHKANQI